MKYIYMVAYDGYDHYVDSIWSSLELAIIQANKIYTEYGEWQIEKRKIDSLSTQGNAEDIYLRDETTHLWEKVE